LLFFLKNSSVLLEWENDLTDNAKIRLLILAVVFVSFICFSRLDAASFKRIGSGEAYAVSADGSTVVGRNCNGGEAFRWTESGGRQMLGFLPESSSWSEAHDVSADGSVVVGTAEHDFNNFHGNEAFRWTESGGMVGLGELDTNGEPIYSQGFGVSADGSVVIGQSRSIQGHQAFRWTESGGMVGLGDLPGGEDFYSWAFGTSADGLVVVGVSYSPLGLEAFQWTESEGIVGMGLMSGGECGSEARAASADGSVIVGWGHFCGHWEAFRWTQSEGMISLGEGTAHAVSADGSVVVGSSDGAFIWDQSHGMQDLKEVLENDYGLDLTGWTLTMARGISDDGLTIVGYGNNGAWVAKIKPLVIMPDVVGMLLSDAESAITSIGLIVGDLTREYSDTVPEGRVISHEPQGGREFEIGGEVNMIMSLGPRISVIVYVDDDAPNGGDGTSWANAFKYLADALNTCSAPGDVLIAKGIYIPDQNSNNPDGTGNRDAMFQLMNDVIIKGGFAGFGALDPNARNIDLYETILSGDLDGNDIGDLDDPSRSENSYTVVFADGTDTNAVLDGVIITAGNANYMDSHLITPWTETGGGMYNSKGSPTLIDCRFISNSARYQGGGMFNKYGSPVLINCVLRNNSAAYSGGGMYCYYSDATLSNCIFNRNSADTGGGMRNYSSDLVLTNCTFSSNSAILGGGVYDYGSNLTLTNCILWGDTPDEIYVSNTTSVVTYCNVQGGWAGDGNNINVDPCFVDPNNGDYHLKSASGRWKPSIYIELDPTGDGFIDLSDFATFANYWQQGSFLPADLDNSGLVDCNDLKLLLDNYLARYALGDWVFDSVNSPCIDTGDPASDLITELWPHGNRINMGAYGGTPQASMSLSTVGNKADLNNDGSVNSEDLALFVEMWLVDDLFLPENINRKDSVNISDWAEFASQWLWEE